MASAETNIVDEKLMKAIGGKEREIVVNGVPKTFIYGADLLGERGKGIFNHVMLVARYSYYLGQALKEQNIPGYENINVDELVRAAILHDSGKLQGEATNVLKPGQNELSNIVERKAHGRLTRLNFSNTVIKAISMHDFPVTIIDDPYWKIILIADAATGQDIRTVEEKFDTSRDRWIGEGKIDPERFVVARANCVSVRNEIFTALNTTEQDFIRTHQLNDNFSMPDWEKELREKRK